MTTPFIDVHKNHFRATTRDCGTDSRATLMVALFGVIHMTIYNIKVKIELNKI
jgi:hypothetical protein